MWRLENRLLGVVLAAVVICMGASACTAAPVLGSVEHRLPLTPDPSPVRVLYVGNLCAGRADTHLEQMATALVPSRPVAVDSVVIPTY